MLDGTGFFIGRWMQAHATSRPAVAKPRPSNRQYFFSMTLPPCVPAAIGPHGHCLTALRAFFQLFCRVLLSSVDSCCLCLCIPALFLDGIFCNECAHYLKRRALIGAVPMVRRLVTTTGRCFSVRTAPLRDGHESSRRSLERRSRAVGLAQLVVCHSRCQHWVTTKLIYCQRRRQPNCQLEPDTPSVLGRFTALGNPGPPGRRGSPGRCLNRRSSGAPLVEPWRTRRP